MKKFVAFCTVLAAGLVQAGEYNPVANPQAVVVEDQVRFTVLTPRVVRMEWSEKGQFEDRGSLVFLNRGLPVPEFTKEVKGEWLSITTDELQLSYRLGSGPFDDTNLKVDFSTGDMKGSWRFGQENKGNLKGTAQTVDSFDGTTHFFNKTRKLKLETGILSRDGWVVIDDTNRPVFDHSDWAWVDSRDEAAHQDLYFFAYGYDFKTALADYTTVAGNIALPPRYAFGYWFSRWRSFSEKEFRELVEEFEQADIPLDVLVIDMDWHLVNLPEFFKDGKRQRDQAGQSCGWTGFTWNKEFIPNPDDFIKWTGEKGLKTCLNLHPASGFHPHEEMYEEVATAAGIDPETKKYVPFTITDKNFAELYFDKFIHPNEEKGMDFWWLDWQQWGTTKIPGVNPIFYLNYVHYSDMERSGKVRPLIYHRWGGLGNHRYQIGFSGDAYVSWKSLDFQPYFTSTAGNVGWGYWGNDIGGYFCGNGYFQGNSQFDPEKHSDELFTRWFQFGVMSPIVKTHANEDYMMKRRLWLYPYETFKHLRELTHFRYAMIPYIYNAAHQAYETGVSLCRPMYYNYPKAQEAYDFKNEYMFGDDLLFHPVTKAIKKGEMFVEQETWLPAGNKWYEWYSGKLFDGDQIISRPFMIDEMPLYARAGAIIPMQPKMDKSDAKPVDPLILNVVPGDSGSLSLYEDEGNNNNFKLGKFTYTTVSLDLDENGAKLTIAPVDGKFDGMLKKRGYEIRYLGTMPPASVNVDGKKYSHSRDKEPGTWYYDGDELATIVYIPSKNVKKKKTVELSFNKDGNALADGKKQMIRQLYNCSVFQTENRYRWDETKYPREIAMRSGQTGLRMTYDPDTAAAELAQMDKDWIRVLDMTYEYAATNNGKSQTFAPYSRLFKAMDNRYADTEVPAVPSDLKIRVISTSQLRLRWTDKTAGKSRFKLERKTGTDGAWTCIKRLDSGTISYSDSQLDAASEYRYRICTYNTVGDSAFSNEAAAIPGQLPQGPVWAFAGPKNFNGTSDFQTLPNPSIADGATELTFTVEVTPKSKTGVKGIITNTFDSNEYCGLLISGYGKGHPVEFRILSDNILSPDFSCPVGKTTHIVGVWKSGKYMKLYLNGVEVSSRPSPPSGELDVTQWFVGRDREISGRFFDGEIKNLKIWVRALSEKEIKDLAAQ